MEAHTSMSLAGKHLPFTVMEIQATATMQAHVLPQLALPCLPNMSYTVLQQLFSSH